MSTEKSIFINRKQLAKKKKEHGEILPTRVGALLPVGLISSHRVLIGVAGCKAISKLIFDLFVPSDGGLLIRCWFGRKREYSIIGNRKPANRFIPSVILPKRTCSHFSSSSMGNLEGRSRWEEDKEAVKKIIFDRVIKINIQRVETP